jgi:hypothetical protein
MSRRKAARKESSSWAPQYLETLDRKEIERNLIRRREKLGHRVILEPVA